MIKVVIIDDEAPARKLIAGFLQEFPEFKVVATIDNAIEGLDFLKLHPVDLLFLDVQMPRITGLELLKLLPTKQYVILTTAYREHAVEGFELEVIDYLLKPISKERFTKSVERYLQKYKEIKPIEETITLKVGKEVKQIPTNRIYLIEGLKDYIKVYTHEGQFVVYERMSAMEQLLSSAQFARIHKSYIVSKQFISKKTHNKISVEGIEVPIGRAYRHNLD